MKNVIYKYQINMAERQTIDIPGDPMFLTVQLQAEQPVLWAIINTSEPMKRHVFRIVGTGNKMPEFHGRYIATFQTPPFVWHFFYDAGESGWIDDPKSKMMMMVKTQ